MRGRSMVGLWMLVELCMPAPALAQAGCAADEPAEIGRAPTSTGGVAVGRGPSGYLVAWTLGAHRVGVRPVSEDGRASAALVEIDIRGGRSIERVEAIGDRWLLVTRGYCAGRSYGAWCVNLRALDPSGRPLGPALEERERSSARWSGGSVAIAGGALYVTADRWRRGLAVRRYAIEPDGSVSGRPVIEVPWWTWWDAVLALAARGDRIVALVRRHDELFFYAEQEEPVRIDHEPLDYSTLVTGFATEGDHYVLYYRPPRERLRRVDVHADGTTSQARILHLTDPLPASRVQLVRGAVALVDAGGRIARRPLPFRAPRAYGRVAVAGDPRGALLVRSFDSPAGRVISSRRIRCD